jgi:hypothetical protein
MASSGYPAGAGGKSSGLAQSGGKNTTFGTSGGGTKQTKGVTAGASEGTGTNGAGLQYTIRSSGGDKTTTPWKGTVGGTPPQMSGGLQPPIQSLRKIRPPTRGGSS